MVSAARGQASGGGEAPADCSATAWRLLAKMERRKVLGMDLAVPAPIARAPAVDCGPATRPNAFAPRSPRASDLILASLAPPFPGGIGGRA